MVSSVGVRGIREMRQMADRISNDADRQRAVLIDQLGLKRYIFNALGEAAHLPADDVRLVWPKDVVELVEGDGAKLGEYLYLRARREQRLPRAVVVGKKKYHL